MGEPLVGLRAEDGRADQREASLAPRCTCSTLQKSLLLVAILGLSNINFLQCMGTKNKLPRSTGNLTIEIFETDLKRNLDDKQRNIVQESSQNTTSEQTTEQRLNITSSGCPLIDLTNCNCISSFATNYLLFSELLAELATELPIGLHYTVTLCPPYFGNTLKVMFQLEHNLVMRGGRDTQGALVGRVPDDKGGLYLVRVIDLPKYDSVDLIIEYSIPNIVNIMLSGHFSTELTEKIVYVPPLPWAYTQGSSQNRSIDVLVMFSCATQNAGSRRKDVVDGLVAAGVNVTSIYGLDPTSEALRNKLDKAKVLVNIHQTPHHHTLEEFRVLPALSRGVVVISEAVPLEKFVPYSDQIIFTPYDCLIDAVITGLRDYYMLYEKIHQSSRLEDVIKNMRQEAKSDLRMIAERETRSI